MSRPQPPLAAHVTGRGIFIGCVLCAVIAIGAPYGRQLIQGTSLALTSATPIAFFLFFVLLLTLHLVLGWCRRGWALQRGELITIFTMMMVLRHSHQRRQRLLMPMITGTFYYATPENDWVGQIHPWLPSWILVANPRSS